MKLKMTLNEAKDEALANEAKDDGETPNKRTLLYNWENKTVNFDTDNCYAFFSNH